MTRRPRRGPSSFGEWIIGTTVESALGPIPAARTVESSSGSRRSVVKFQVVTDDETEEDTLTVTYPRSGSSGSSRTAAGDSHRRRVVNSATETEECQDDPTDEETEDADDSDTTTSSIKKVRFEISPAPPRKSAMKRDRSAGSRGRREESEPESCSSSGDFSDSSRSDDCLLSKGKRKKRHESSREVSSSEIADGGSRPHPLCDCSNCRETRKILRQGRKRQGTGGHQNVEEWESEADSVSDSEAGKQQKQKQKQKKGAKKSVSFNVGADEGGSPKGKKGKHKQNKNKEDSSTSEAVDTEDDADGVAEGGSSSKQASNNKSKEKQKQKQKQKGDDGRTKQAVDTGSRPHHPQLLEPTRANVVQTEQVVEGPEDPIPNAYYDPHHKLLRVYHGPIYGGNHHQSLYPAHDGAPSYGGPHPPPHPFPPPHNPYPYGQGQEQQQQYPPWHSPHGFATPGHYGNYHDAGMYHIPPGYGFPPPPHHGTAPVPPGFPSPTLTRNHPVPATDGPKLGNENPYYHGNNGRSRFSSFGRADNGPSGDTWASANESSSRDDAWGQTSASDKKNSQPQNEWGGQSNNNTPWDSATSSSNNQTASQADNNWGSSNNGQQSEWNNTKDSSDNNAGFGDANKTSSGNTWDVPPQQQQTSPPPKGDGSVEMNNIGPVPVDADGGAGDASHVMPGTFLPDKNYTADWQDSSMAAGGETSKETW